MTDATKMATPKPATAAMAPKRCTCGGVAGPTGECEECKKKNETVQRASNGGPALSAVPASVNRAIGSAGRPLDPGPRSSMESRFGRDFSGVRIHTDSQAANSARDVNARAYTVGQHIAFDRGQYQPDTPTGQHLLAHELAHTVQQRGATPSAQRLAVDPVDSPAEREADAAARSAARGAHVVLHQQPTVARLQRAPLTWRQILDLEVPPEERISGTRVHTVIGEDFAAKVGEGRIGFEIPGGAAGAFKSEDCGDEASSEIEPQIFDPYGKRQGVGKPDLAYQDGTRVEMAEIKIGTYPCLPTAQDQLQHYLDASRLPDNKDWRDRRGFRTFSKMSSARYKPPNPIDVDGRQVAVAWVSEAPGVIVYKPIPSAAAPPAESAVVTEPYVIKVGVGEITFQLPPAATGAKAEQVPLHESIIPGNKEAAESLQGIILKTLTRKSKGNDTISAAIETKANPKSTAPSTQPLTVEGPQDVVTLVVNKQTRQLSQQSKKVNIPFTFKGLSQGAITSLTFSEETGLSGEGQLRPSIPLLSGINLGIRFGPNDLAVTAGIPKEKLKVPIPGFRVTKAELALVLAPEFKPSGEITFAIGPETKPYLDGSIVISADTEGFLAKGTVIAHIPGVDKGKGEITYRPATGWVGTITISTSPFKYVQDASVTVQMSDKGLQVDGGLTVILLEKNTIGVQIKKRGERWIYTGTGTLVLPVPAVKPVNLTVSYDGDRIWGEGTAGFSVRGVSGTMTVKYNNGLISGSAKVDIEKGKAKGSLNVCLNDRGRIFGDGEINYQLTPTLVVVLGIELPETGPLRVKSGFKLPKPIPLFDKKEDNFQLFSIEFPFWIPYVSIPGVAGLKVEIRGGLDLGYYLGAGVIRDVAVMAAFNPLEDNPDLAIQLGGELYIPFGGKLKGSITAALELDGFVAGVSAGITAWAEAKLGCEFKLRADFQYAKERYEVAARAGFFCALTFELGLEFIVQAFLATFDEEWKWPIAGFKWDPGLSVGAAFPFKYASDQPFTPPSFNQIEWTKPNLDPERMLSSLIDAAKK